MSYATIFTINTVLAGFHGLLFLLAPTFAMAFYGMPPSQGAEVLARLFGAQLLGLAIFFWQGRRLGDPAGQRLIAFGTAIQFALGTVISVWAVLTGGMGIMGWLGVAIYGLLALGHASAVRRAAA